MAPSLVGAPGPVVSGAGDHLYASLAGRAFYKLTGSGNDFVFFDERAGSDVGGNSAALRTPEVIAAVCDRRNGIGADGVVFLEVADSAEVQIAYYNRDGSRAALCGNATLCTARLAAVLGAVPDPRAPFVVATDAGRIEARVDGSADPVIALGPVRDVAAIAPGAVPESGERAIGYALAGVPHLVVLVDDVDRVPVDARGAALRAPTNDRPDGANVNWVAPVGDRWRMRTFERGVEGETLACGTGAVATATLIAQWTGSTSPVVLVTSSGRAVEVTPTTEDGGAALLAGEGRLVFAGRLAAL
ncbi:diaminopimelate epimerase [Gemmatimonadetes bacterium T265]|nr:diaminopimelate epimerase [Gemmatimonadetes bacterium T265]